MNATAPLPAMVQVLVIREAMGIPARTIMNAPTTTASMAIAAIPPAQRSARHVMSKAPLGAVRMLQTGYKMKMPAEPALLPIMPALVNPVICESWIQVTCRVLGNYTTLTSSGLGWVGSLFELNVAMPVMIDAFLESVKLLANVSRIFVDKLLNGLEVNEARCSELIGQSLMMVTSLAPAIGYEEAAALAKEAHATGQTIRDLCLQKQVLPADELDLLLDPDAMTRPSA